MAESKENAAENAEEKKVETPKATEQKETAKPEAEVKAEKTTTPKPDAETTPVEAKAKKAAENSEEKETKAKRVSKPKQKVEVSETAIVEDKTTDAEEVKSEEKPKTREERQQELETFRKEFDWNAIGKYDDKYNDAEQADLEKMYDETLTSIQEQDVIDGKVVSITSREVVVDIGYKSDGVISMSELKYRDELEVGDVIEVFIESQEDKNGQLVLSHRKARHNV